jgi:subfamily B ATP-binding cassette protein MsbA
MGMGEMLVTMQETFAGIRVIKSFARETHQGKSFKRSNQLPCQMMRLIRSMEGSGRWSNDRGHRSGYGVALRLRAGEPQRRAVFWLIIGISSLLYDPIKTLSKIHIVMQQSIWLTTEIFSILIPSPRCKTPGNA